MKKIFLILLLIIGFLFLGGVSAEEKLVFDSSDHYLGGCQLTNKAEWEQKEDMNVTTFQLWYSWNQGETTIPVTVYLDGEKFAEFEAARSQCDPYQRQWCNADYKINKVFAKGKYSVEIPESRMCLKPGGTGTVRLYDDVGDAKKDEPTPTVKTVAKTEPTEVQPTVIVPVKQANGCSCNQTTIVITAVVSSAVTSFLVSLLMKK